MTATPETRAEAEARYRAAVHAVQSGVATMMNYDPNSTSRKHLRTGVNSALVSNTALVKLLEAKGLISGDEYMTALADEMEAERDRYRQEIADTTGVDVERIHLA